MIFQAYALAITLSGGAPEAYEVASAARDVVLESGALPLAIDVDEANDRTVRLLVAWSYRESRWIASALDSAHACGVMQVSAWYLSKWGTTCARVRASRAEGFRVGLLEMRERIATCGGVRAGLGSYASGKCGAAPGLVAYRCALAGGAC